MDKYTNNKPNAAKLLESLRNSGYDNYSAIADLIDNSFDANADQVKVSIGEGEKNEHVITIADNGDGMDERTLDQALRLGSLTNQDNEKLGKYGMGLITASISIGRRLVVVTKKEGKYLTGIHDLDEVVSKNEFVKEIRESNDSERNAFMTALGSTVSGTLVIVQKIDNLKNHNLTSFSNTLIKNCGEIFRDFLHANKSLTINRKLVLAIDPMMRNDNETDEFLDKTHEFNNEKGETSSVRIRVFHLPKFTKQEATDKKINQTSQGFYVMRNNRQIAGGVNLGVFLKHNDFNRFRVEIYFNGSLDNKIGVNFRKQDISLSEDIRVWIDQTVTPQLETIRGIAKNEQAKSRVVIDHTPTERMISSRSSVLKKPRIDEDDASADYITFNDEGFVNVKFEVENNTHLAPLFQLSLKGDSMTINYNADHPFYDAVIAARSEDKDLINAINSLVYSAAVALVDITSSQDRIELKDRFLDGMSDNLRSLLS